jgi:multidrug efflux pump
MRGTGLVDAAFARAKVAMLTLVVLAGLGLGTFLNAPREADPDIPLPFVNVLLPLPGISPEDAERLLIRPTETELQTLEGLVQMDAIAFDGAASISLEFEPGLDMAQTVTQVREAVDRAKAEYPAAAEEPLVEEANAQSIFPVLTVVLSGDAPEAALFRAAKQLETRLTGVPGVLEARLVGAREEQVEILISPTALENYNLSPGEIGAALRQNNALVTAGTLRFEDGSYAVKVPGLIKALEEIENVPLRATGDDLITIGDVAEVRRAFEDRTGFASFNGEPAIGIDVTKRSETNLIEITELVKAEARAVAGALPETVHLAFIGDQSTMVESTFDSLTSSIMLAILLVMIVVVAALGLRSALLVGIAIPSTFLIGLAFIGFFGFTLNQLVMFSMVLAVGMLVDGAIVVVELADRRIAEGLPRRDAFIEASKRMYWPIVASTATTLAAFVPFLFWNSIEGYFLRWIPITLILVLSASLLVALLFLPIIGAAFGIPPALKRRFNLKGRADARPSVDLDNIDPRTLRGATGTYARAIDHLASRPVLVATLAVIGIFFCQRIFTLAEVEVEQFLRVDSEQVLVLVQGRGNLSPEETLLIADEIRAQIEDHPAIEHIYLQTGPQIARQGDVPTETIALISIDLLPYQDRTHSLTVIEELRDRTSRTPGVKVEVRAPEQGPMVGKDVQVELSAPDDAAAREAARAVRAFMEGHRSEVHGRSVPTFMEIEDNQPLPGIEWGLEVDRAAAGRYGLTVSDVGAAVQLATEGLIVDTYRPDDSDEELEIRIRYPEEERSIAALDRVTVATPAGNVPLANFVDRIPQRQVDRVTRRDSRRIMEVKGNASTEVPGFEVSQDRATAVMQAWLESGALAEAAGPGVSYRLRGAAEERNQSSAFFVQAMVAAMFMIGVILLLQFNNFYHAVLTLTAVVMSVFGVLLGVALSGQYISVIMTGIGIVALAGIVVNNNIVLIDTYHTLRNMGLDVRDAVVRTAAQRLRPVLLTTVTTIIGLMPMMFEIDIDWKRGVLGIGNETSDWWVLLSSAIVYGLAFATLLTLIITPVLLAAPSVLAERLRQARGKVVLRRRIGRRREKDKGRQSPPEEDYRTAAE